MAASTPVRGLVVSNMQPEPTAPARGSFVRDQVAALSRRADVQVELLERPRTITGYLRTAIDIRRARRRRGFLIFHAHFGLSQWPLVLSGAAPRAITLHGTDLRHPVTRVLTGLMLGRMDLVATVSSSLARLLPARALASPVAALPCGVDLERFRPIPRTEARVRLGLDPDEPVLLFPADPERSVKRYDRAREATGDVRLLTAGAVPPEEMPWWVNAANAVLVPSDAEGFGLSVLEALACDVPVLATPVGVHPVVLGGLPGALCAPYERGRWRDALAPIVAASDPRIPGRPRAALFSSDRMAERVVVAWRATI